MSITGILVRAIDHLFGIEPVYAHCDVPCGIYDPHLAAVSAKTVYTMNKKLTDFPRTRSGAAGTSQHHRPHGPNQGNPLPALQTRAIDFMGRLL